MRKIYKIGLVFMIMLSLTGCKRELPSVNDVKSYISNNFEGGYDLEYIGKYIDNKGYENSNYKVRLKNLYNTEFDISCTTKESLFNLSGISDNFQDKLRSKFIRENRLSYGIINKNDYEYHIKLEKDLSEYKNVHFIIKYILNYESKYIYYKESFYKDYRLESILSNRVLANESKISAKAKLIINNKLELRLWDYDKVSFDEAKLKYEIYINKEKKNE